MSFKRVETFASAAVATNGTFTLSYPANTNAGSFAGFGHKVWVDKFQRLLVSPTDITVAFGASTITVTYKGATTIPVGARLDVQLNQLGEDDGSSEVSGRITNVSDIALAKISLGAPITADADGYCVSQDLTALGVFSVSATAAAAIAAAALAGTADVGRNVVAAWTGTAVITITGTDILGAVVKESSASGTSLAGKKAFKTVTGISVSANVTALTVGTGDVLGLPVFLPGTGYVLRELQDGAAPTAGTLVAGVSTVGTATSGDPRGTYDPNAACDGAKVFDLVAALPDPEYRGLANYAG